MVIARLFVAPAFFRRGVGSALVAQARELGYTEPDPRDDLSGTDVARKMVILAREMGMAMELADVDVRSLVPEALQQGSVSDFLAALPNHDAEVETLRRDAAGVHRQPPGELSGGDADGRVLRR